MPWPVHPTGFFGARGDQDTYRIERSLRFNSADSAYLNRTPASAGNRKTWTWSGWVKVGALSTERIFLSNTDTSGRYGLYFGFRIPNTLEIGDYGFSSFDWVLTTSALFRDTSAWYHIVASVDTTQATASNRVRLYVNGSQISSFSASTYPSLNADLQINSTSPMSIGRVNNNSYFYDGYITEVYFIDGQALTPSSFGETDAITGRWKAKAYGGTYGTNGFYLKFADNSGTTATTLGKDSSGNGNNWTPNNFSVTAGAGNDSLVDSPTNYGTDTGVGGEVRGNYATLNPLFGSTNTIQDGNLVLTGANGGNTQRIGSVAVSSGKWYYEVSLTTLPSLMDPLVGFTEINNPSALTQYPGTASNSYAIWQYSGNTFLQKVNSGVFTNTNTSVAVQGDTLGVALDLDAGRIWFSKNGVWVDGGNPASGTNAQFTGLTGTFAPAARGTGGANTTTLTFNFGQRPFAYAAPSGFKALCTTNLPTPTIQKPSRYMDVVTYTGTGATQTISGLGFSPDFLWTKGRSLAQSHNIFDTQRSGQRLRSDTTGAEASTTVTLGSNGFTLGTETESNNSGSTFVAWAWDAGESSSTNTAGSITSTVRVNPLAGVSICTFNVGASGAKTFGHGLNSAPRMVIVKSRTSALGWTTYHASVITATNQYIQLNTTSAILSVAGIWGSALPTSSVVGIGSGTNVNANDDCVAYCFAEVEGFSKFGSYTGNGSADGPFVWCGFRPRWVMIKYTSGSISNINNAAWLIVDSARDTSNVVTKELDANNSSSEATVSSILDFTSNGFKVRWAPSDVINSNGATYIFAAFAESPFKYARAR